MDNLPPGSYDDRAPPLRNFVIAMMVLITVMLALRFWSRLIAKSAGPSSAPANGLWWDDWAALGATVVMMAQLIMSLFMFELGAGRHIWMVDSHDLAVFLKMFWAVYFVYDVALVLAKESALLFLSRIFPPYCSKPWFHRTILVFHVLNVTWLVGIALGTVFQCDPVSKNWDPMLPGYCAPASSLFIGSAVTSVFIDLAILILPMPQLWSLNMNRKKKFAVTIIFVLGYSVIVVSLGRLITVLKSADAINQDLTYEGVPSFYWITLEVPIILLSVCLPSLMSLGRYLNVSCFRPLASKVSIMFSYGSNSVLGNTTGNFVGLSETTLHRPRKPAGQMGQGGVELESRLSIDSRSRIIQLSPPLVSHSAEAHGWQRHDSQSVLPPTDSIHVRSDVEVRSVYK